jgi:hypothetical protein
MRTEPENGPIEQALAFFPILDYAGKVSREKDSSLFCLMNSDDEKSFIILTTII